jgi:hypothetical protein
MINLFHQGEYFADLSRKRNNECVTSPNAEINRPLNTRKEIEELSDVFLLPLT